MVRLKIDKISLLVINLARYLKLSIFGFAFEFQLSSNNCKLYSVMTLSLTQFRAPLVKGPSEMEMHIVLISKTWK